MVLEKPARILIVEDESIVALDLGETVISLGYELAGYATTAADALFRAEQQKPDLVLMDIRLGLSDGVAAARQIRERLGIAVIFVSAFSSDLDRRGLANLGPIVPKPFTTESLRKAIQGVLTTASV